MENQTVIRKQSANIIYRYITRVQARNQAFDYIQKDILGHQQVINDCTLIGTIINNLDNIYQYRLPVNGSVVSCYVYDIRELIVLLRTSYQHAKCPYTNQYFTGYQKYHMVRTYYNRKRSLKEFEDLIMEHISHRDYSACSERISGLIDIYNRFDIEQVNDRHLLDILTELIKYETKECSHSVNYISQAHHHYINGNLRNFRACSYMFMIKMIENASDADTVALRIKKRINFCTQFATNDPLNYLGIILDLTMTIPSQSPSPIGRRQRDEGDGEPPSRRRRLDSGASDADGESD